MNAKEALVYVDETLLAHYEGRAYDARGHEALSVLSALADENATLKRDLLDAYAAATEKNKELAALKESVQFKAYEELRGRLVDALKERDALQAELTALRSEADAARPLIEAAQTEPTSAAVDYLLRVVSGYAGTIKNLGQVTLDSTDLPFLESIRSLILSAPSPRVVSREWVRQRATDLDNGCEYCGAESTGNPSEIGIASMLKELGIEVAEVVL